MLFSIREDKGLTNPTSVLRQTPPLIVTRTMIWTERLKWTLTIDQANLDFLEREKTDVYSGDVEKLCEKCIFVIIMQIGFYSDSMGMVLDVNHRESRSIEGGRRRWRPNVIYFVFHILCADTKQTFVPSFAGVPTAKSTISLHDVPRPLFHRKQQFWIESLRLA